MDQQASTSKPSQKESKASEEGLFPILKKICKNGPVSYFHVVLDPTSFTRTAENIYWVSCLASEGKVSVYKDPKVGLPFLNTMSESGGRRPENSEENQFVISMNMERWKELIEVFDIKEPMLKIN